MATRLPSGQIDLHETHDFPIILGESLKDLSRSQSKYVQFRYNWEPSSGFRKCRGTLKQSNNELRLSYSEDKSSTLSSTYSGFYPSRNDRAEKDQPGLVLVYDESKTAFVLEKISTSVDLNVVSATELTTDDIRNQRQLRRPHSDESLDMAEQLQIDMDDGADTSNPFDFRHFLNEARETMEKTALQPGSWTPLPGNSTPIPRVSSPSISGGRFTHTPSFMPATATTTATTTKKGTTNQSTTKTKPVRKTQAKRKEPTSSKVSQPLSKARISDSDEEVDDAIPVEPAQTKGHSRNTAQNQDITRPSRTVSGGGGLEIIGASPPPEPRSYKIDVEAFRSQSHTPAFGQSRSRMSPPRTENDDIIMKDADHSDSSEEDGDVETFELDNDSRSRRDDRDQIQPIDTPPAPEENDGEDDDDDDDNDALAAKLMEALEEEEGTGGDNAMNGYGHVDDDESEVSEEE